MSPRFSSSTALAFAVWLFLLRGAFAQIGGLDTSFNTGPILNGASAGIIRSQAVLSSGQTLIAGDFTTVAGIPRGRIARLNAAGSLDVAFATGAGADGVIHAIVVQADGKIIIGGEFTTFDGVARNRIARLTATGALDTTFNPGTGFNGPVFAIAANASASSIYVGGDFTASNGSTRNRLAVLSGTGSRLSDTFEGGVNAAVRALRLDTSYLYVGGDFTIAGGETRNSFARYVTTLDALDPISVSFNGPVHAIEIINLGGSSTPLLIVAGDFTVAASAPRGRLAGFNLSSGSSLPLNPDFNFWLDAPCRQIATVSTNRVFIGGDFTSVNGQPRSRFARLTYTTTGGGSSSIEYWDIDASYGATGPDGVVNTVRVTSDGKPLLGGAFGNFGGSATSPFVRVYGDNGSLPPSTPGSPAAAKLSDSQIYVSWNGSSAATAYSLERSADGVAGWIQAYSGSTTNFIDGSLPAGATRFYRIRASNSNGDSAYTATVSATTSPTPWSGSGSLLGVQGAGFADGSIASMLRQPDGKILIAGSFLNVLGTPRKYIARLLPDLSLDLTFDPGVGPNSSISQIARAPDGRIFIFGSFSTVSGVTRYDIARLNTDGSHDLSFDTHTDWTFSKGILVRPDGKLIVFGNFQTFFGAPRDYIVRLNVDGSVDTGFNCNLGSAVDSAALGADGNILLGGWFRTINGVSAAYLARVLPSGAVDPSFIGSTPSVFTGSTAALPDGKHLVAGSFSTISGVARKYIARLHSNGSVDASFDPGLGTNSSVPLIFPQPDGRVVIAGSFTSFAGTTRWKLARLNADGTLDATFDSEAGPATGTINAVLPLPDSSLLVGGSFTAFGTSSRAYLVRLNGGGYPAAPATPANLAGVPVSASSIHLAWDQLADEYSWKIERSPAGAALWQQIAELSWDITTFADTALAAATSYDYRIRATNGTGDSPFSTIATVATFTPYLQWKQDQGFSPTESETSDTDGDGLSLAIEYALALNPRVPQLDGLPVPQTLGDVLAFSYRRYRSDVLYSVEASTDVVNWSPVGVNQGSGPFPIAWTLKNGAPQKYLRLRVMIP